MTTEPMYAGEFILSEATRSRSRDQVTIAQNQALLAGTVLGLSSVGALSVSAAKTGAGNGVITGSTIAAGSKVGKYVATCVAAVANAGSFMLQDPDGVDLGEITVAVAFNLGGLAGTIADGSADWAAGDTVVYTVSEATGLGEYERLNPSATDGDQAAAGISFAPVTTGSGVTAQAVAITRDAEVKSACLDWGSLTDDQVAAATVQLAALGIIVR
jgi:hypothetical protein